MVRTTFPACYRIRVFWNRARYLFAGAGIMMLLPGIIGLNLFLIVLGVIFIAPILISLTQDIEWCSGYIDRVKPDHDQI